jgi:hypothetical protein
VGEKIGLCYLLLRGLILGVLLQRISAGVRAGVTGISLYCACAGVDMVYRSP